MLGLLYEPLARNSEILLPAHPRLIVEPLDRLFAADGTAESTQVDGLASDDRTLLAPRASPSNPFTEAGEQQRYPFGDNLHVLGPDWETDGC